MFDVTIDPSRDFRFYSVKNTNELTIDLVVYPNEGISSSDKLTVKI